MRSVYAWGYQGDGEDGSGWFQHHSVPLSTAGHDSRPTHNELRSPKTTARCTGLIYWFCCCSHKPHTNSPRQIQRKHVCTIGQLPHWFWFWRERDLLFVDLVCRACAQTLAKHLALTSRTFVYSRTGAIFIRAVFIKQMLLWICDPLESRCQKKRISAPYKGLLSLSQKAWEGREFPLSRSMDRGNCQRYLGARAMSSLFFPKPLSLAKQQPAGRGSRWESWACVCTWRCRLPDIHSAEASASSYCFQW